MDNQSFESIIHSAALKKMKGEYIYNYAVGDPVIQNHPSIIDKILKHMETKLNPYPDPQGICNLRKLAAGWMNTWYQTQYSKENVIVSMGGRYAIFSLITTLLNSQEEVLIISPCWVALPGIVKLAGCITKVIPSFEENDWKITGKDVLQHTSKNSKILMLNNANNPTGMLYTREELRDILSAAKTAGLTVISDEVYSGLVYEDAQFVSCGSFREFDHVIVVQSCSKNFGMTGWRVGFAFGPENIIKYLISYQGQTIRGVPLICQWAAVGALEDAKKVNDYIRTSMQEKRDLFVDVYNSLFQPIKKPVSALYVFVPISGLGSSSTDSASFCRDVLNKGNVALAPGVAFGQEGYVRMAFVEPDEDIRQGLHTLHSTVNEFNLGYSSSSGKSS